jgi:hypothetical protein
VVGKSFLDQAAAHAYKELERLGGDPSKLEVPLQTVAILYYSQAIIDNGGFRYLFENDLPFCPPYSMLSNAYRRIGANQDADRLERAVAMFPFENPHLYQEKRLAFMDSLEENDEFFELGDEVCGDKKVWTALEDYAQKNAETYRVM